MLHYFQPQWDSLYKNSGDVVGVLDQYLKAQEIAVRKYLDSMNIAAQKIYDINTSGDTGQNLAIEAAKTISDIPDNILSSNDPSLAKKCKSNLC